MPWNHVDVGRTIEFWEVIPFTSPISARRVQPEWPEALEAGLAPGIRHPEGAKPCYSSNRFRRPLRVDLEVPGCGSNGGVTAVVQDHQPARANQFAQEEEINEDVVKVSVDHRGSGDTAPDLRWGH